MQSGNRSVANPQYREDQDLSLAMHVRQELRAVRRLADPDAARSFRAPALRADKVRGEAYAGDTLCSRAVAKPRNADVNPPTNNRRSRATRRQFTFYCAIRGSPCGTVASYR